MHKIIGIYKDFNGPEEKSMKNIIEKYGIVGSMSDFIKNIEIYYTENGSQMIVVHNSNKYYGKDNIDTPEIDDMLKHPMVNHTTVENAANELSKKICKNLELLLETKKMSEENTAKLIKELILEQIYPNTINHHNK